MLIKINHLVTLDFAEADNRSDFGKGFMVDYGTLRKALRTLDQIFVALRRDILEPKLTICCERQAFHIT